MKQPNKINKKYYGSWTNLSKDEKKGFEKWRSELPSNLRGTGKEYDLTGAWKSGAKPGWVDHDEELRGDKRLMDFYNATGRLPEAIEERDGKLGMYHLTSRDPQTGRYFKSIKHPSALMAAEGDVNQGGEAYIVRKGPLGRRQLYTGSESDPIAPNGRVIKQGDEALQFLKRKNATNMNKYPNGKKGKTTAGGTPIIPDPFNRGPQGYRYPANYGNLINPKDKYASSATMGETLEGFTGNIPLYPNGQQFKTNNATSNSWEMADPSTMSEDRKKWLGGYQYRRRQRPDGSYEVQTSKDGTNWSGVGGQTNTNTWDTESAGTTNEALTNKRIWGDPMMQTPGVGPAKGPMDPQDASPLANANMLPSPNPWMKGFKQVSGGTVEDGYARFIKEGSRSGAGQKYYTRDQLKSMYGQNQQIAGDTPLYSGGTSGKKYPGGLASAGSMLGGIGGLVSSYGALAGDEKAANTGGAIAGIGSVMNTMGGALDRQAMQKEMMARYGMYMKPKK